MSKKGENIRKRKDGRWEGRYIANRDHMGRAIYRSLYGKTYSEVKQRMKQQRMYPKEKISEAYDVNLGTVLNKWLENNKIRYKPATYLKYQYLIERHILPSIGKFKVKDLTASNINTFLNIKLISGGLQTKGALSSSYVRTMALIINAALNYAVAEELCAPMKSSIYKPTPRQPKIKTLSHMEYNTLSVYCAENQNLTNLGIQIALNTGLRVGEICALKWSDIDIKNHLIHVNSTISRVGNKEKKCLWILGAPKTTAAIRDIPISNKIESILLTAKQNATSNYVVSENENFINPRTFEYRYHKELNISGVVDINFHGLRHTFATRCVEGGMDIKTLSEILGHSNVSVTLNTYVHSSTELKKAQLNKVDYFFDRGQE